MQDRKYISKMGDSIDWLSDLPDPILTHVLSLMSTKEAVGTCFLSKRWRNLWASIPVLTFYFEQFIAKRNSQHKPKGYYEAKFVQFVQGVLNNRDETLPLEKFQIRFCAWQKYSCTAVEHCMLHALRFKPRVLNVVFAHVTFQTYTSIFTCTTLQDLCWHLFPGGTIPNSVSLPSLKKLQLHAVQIDDGSLSKIFIGCPVLAELSLICCSLKTSRISSNQLRVLDLRFCYRIKKLKVFAPNLFHLKIAGVLIKQEIILENTSFPFTVSLDLTGDEYKLLCGLSNVACLDLTMDCPQENLEKEVCYCSAFNNLKSLTLRTELVSKTFDLIVFFLKHSPNLIKLTFQHKRSKRGHVFYPPLEVAIYEKWSQEEPNDVSFQREYLETIEIIRSFKDESVNWLVNYFNAHVKRIGEIRVI